VRTVLGIRHHGPGSARSLLGALEELAPDCVLIEGPADASDLLAFVADAGTEPPVALLAYAANDPSRSIFYPFARFSPEWQAAAWALARHVPVSFIDLPAAELLAEGPDEERGGVIADPLAALAEAAGYEDPERWWEDMVEHRDGDLDTFAAVQDAMAALREQLDADTPREQRREAHMRHRIAAAEREGRERVAVVCGAWHAPVLAADARAPKPPAVRGAKAVLTWVPWTYDRLARRSGYGAGVTSPGWYEHLFETADEPLVTWLARVAQHLRAHDSDISTAHVIEAARSAQGLAALRGRPLPGLPEITEGLGMVLGEAADPLLALLREDLVIGRKLGRVSERVPTVPLQRDLEATARTLRLKLDPAHRDLELDLRKESDLRRSHLLHRLRLLGIPWGDPRRVSGARGTFREAWRLQWQPEFAVAVIEASGWGPTVPLAATARVRAAAHEAGVLAELTALLEGALLADLPEAVGSVLVAFEASAAVSSDIPALMAGLPALARAARYGSVRQTDTGALGDVLSELLTRIAVGLPAAAAAIDDDAAAELLGHVTAVDGALATLADEALTAEWRGSLGRIMDRADAHPLITGRAGRILRDAGRLDGEQVAQRMDQALSRATEPLAAGAWLEGFLTGSGLALIHDRTLLALVDRWLAAATPNGFTSVLPVLRRTFSSFAAPERRQIGERVRGGVELARPPAADAELDAERAELVIPVLAQLLDVSR
jgi:hypothetical protein